MDEYKQQAHQYAPGHRVWGIRCGGAAADATGAAAHARSAAGTAATDAPRAPVGHGAAVSDVVVLVECVARGVRVQV